MSESQQNMSPDELVYQNNSHKPAVKEVYSNPEETTDPGAGAKGEHDVISAADTDEISAESFPASDAPSQPISLGPTEKRATGDERDA